MAKTKNNSAISSDLVYNLVNFEEGRDGMKIVLATHNQGKIREFRKIFSDMGVEAVTISEIADVPEPEETGHTFEENALIKAKAVMKVTGQLTLADDSGLEIDALNGEPGIYSSRYLGEDTSYVKKNSVILERLKDVPEEKRSARFVCAVAAAFPDGQSKVIRGTMEGSIGYEIKGENGFGYDPIFYLPQYGKYSAELTSDEKNAISHRGEALRRIREVL